MRENLLVGEVQFCYVKTGKVHVIPARHGARLEKLGGVSRPPLHFEIP